MRPKLCHLGSLVRGLACFLFAVYLFADEEVCTCTSLISAFQFQYAETSLLFSLLCNTKCMCFLKKKDTCILVIQDV